MKSKILTKQFTFEGESFSLEVIASDGISKKPIAITLTKVLPPIVIGLDQMTVGEYLVKDGRSVFKLTSIEDHTSWTMVNDDSYPLGAVWYLLPPSMGTGDLRVTPNSPTLPYEFGAVQRVSLDGVEFTSEELGGLL